MRSIALCSALFVAMSSAACGASSHDTSDAGGGRDGATDAGHLLVDTGAGDDGSTGDESSDPDAFYAAYAKAACDRGRRCEALNPYIDGAFCHPGYASHVLEAALDAWRSGRGHADPDAVRACLDAIRAEGCEGTLDPPPEECLLMIVGTVPAGGECATGTFGILSFECEPGLTCIATGECPGRCGAPRLEGEPCSPAHACARDLDCAGETCIRWAQLGEPCSGSSCYPGLVCIDDVCSDGRRIGEACGSGAPCREPLRCAPDDSGATVCQAWYGTELGDRCRPFPHARRCDFPLVCVEAADGMDGICTMGQELGAACDALAPCGPGGRCVGGSCREIVSSGAACDDAHVCTSAHECIDGVCAPLPSEGEPCTDGCAFARCTDGVCVSGESQTGAPCNIHLWHCAPGYHCRDVDGALVCAPFCD